MNGLHTTVDLFFQQKRLVAQKRPRQGRALAKTGDLQPARDFFKELLARYITLHYGADRLDEGRALGLSQKRPLLTFALGCAAALTLVFCVYKRTTPPDPWNAVFLVLGFVAAFGLVILAKVVQLALTDSQTTRHPPPFLVFPAYMIPFAERIFDDIYCWSSPGSRTTKSWFNGISQWPLGILQGAGQGYLADLDPPAGQPLRLRSGHVFAFSLFVIAFLFYLGIGWNKAGIQAADNKVPALAFVLLFLIVACWALSALTFFFDRYRFPLLWTIGVLSLFTLSTPQATSTNDLDADRVLHLARVGATKPSIGCSFFVRFQKYRKSGRSILK